MPTRLGKYTLRLDNSPNIASFAAIGGKKEGEGPLADFFDILCDDTSFGEQTWEKAESRLQKDAVNKALDKAGFSPSDIQYIFAGDLLNQCTSSTYGLRDMGIPFVGLYGACSTMAESIAVSGIFVDAGAADKTVCVTSSHFCSAERQFRFPLEYGGQRTPTSQWTVTAAGGLVMTKDGEGPYVRQVTIGTIEDLGIKDANNMGAAMAPAAAATLQHFFEDTGTTPESFDLIVTGDLGQVGSELLYDLMRHDGIEISKRHTDCGLLIYPSDDKDVKAGASGCGCSASVLCSYLLNKMGNKELNDILFMATGALMSTTSVQQGESIPGVAHLVHLSNTKWQ